MGAGPSRAGYHGRVTTGGLPRAGYHGRVTTGGLPRAGYHGRVTTVGLPRSGYRGFPGARKPRATDLATRSLAYSPSVAEPSSIKATRSRTWSAVTPWASQVPPPVW